MKKVILYILCGISLLGTVSCNDYLEVENKTSTSAQGYVSNYDAALSVLSVCYAKLGTNSDGIMGDERLRIATDLFESWGTFSTLTWDANDTEVIKPLWKKYYKFIADANYAIKVMEENAELIDATFSESVIENSSLIEALGKKSGFSASKMLIGEAKTLRAYAYFTLYRYFGGIPLIDKLQEKAEFVPRSSRDEVFNFLEEDLRFAIENCADSKDGTLYGRISKSSAAGLLAKCYVFQASYIRRAEMYGSQIGEEKSSIDVNTLYNKALSLCDTLINKSIGDNELTPYYPAVFKSRTSEMLICFDGKEASGQGSNYCSIWGIGGNSDYGASGNNSTSQHAIIYDFETWKHNGRSKEMYEYYGAAYYRSFGDFTHYWEQYIDFQANGTYTYTGDTTRRMWNVAKLYITGPTYPNLPEGLWCFEPMGKTLGPEFFIEPGKYEANYTETEKDIVQYALTGKSYVNTWWYDNSVVGTSANGSFVNLYFLYVVPAYWRMAKFRNALPQNIDRTTYDANNRPIQIPILRMAEMYLLKAEAQYFLGDYTGAIASLNKLRDRASNQATMRDMYLNWDKADYKYIPNSVKPIPSDLTGEVLLREILWERARELCGEDTCRWFDISRFPDLLAEVYDTEESYLDPIQRMAWFYMYHLENQFSKNDVHRALLPIPSSEFQYYPDLGQNPGY